MPGRAPQRGNHRRHHGRIQAVFWRHARQRGKGDALWQDDDGADQPGQEVDPQGAGIDHRPPAQERQQGEDSVRGRCGLRSYGLRGYGLLGRGRSQRNVGHRAAASALIIRPAKLGRLFCMVSTS